MADVADESKMGPNEKVVKDFVTKLTMPLQALIMQVGPFLPEKKRGEPYYGS